MYYNFADLNYLNRELAGVWPGWTAVKLLGRGSFGAVYEIHRNVRGNLEKAAVKVLRVPDNDVEIARLQLQGMNPSSIGAYYEDLMDGICNEIRIMQNFVGNSHIVSYEDYYIRKRSDGIGWDLFIRMELLTGLPDYIRLRAFDEKMVLKLGMDVAQGLRDCHGSGIIHRDIKPDNIFVNRVGNFKLGDFGVSRNMPGSSDLLSFKGTLGYMAPEVYKMLSTDARSDIYSLGMVLYQCLNNNRLPFVPEKFTPTDIEIARQKRFTGEPIPAPAHGSDRLKSVVLTALEESPDKRFQNAEDLYFELMSIYGLQYRSGRRAVSVPAGNESILPEAGSPANAAPALVPASAPREMQASAPREMQVNVQQELPANVPQKEPAFPPQQTPASTPQRVPAEQLPYRENRDDHYEDSSKKAGSVNKADRYIKYKEAQKAARDNARPGSGNSGKADQYIRYKEAQNANSRKKIARQGPGKADQYIRRKEAQHAREEKERAALAASNYAAPDGYTVPAGYTAPASYAAPAGIQPRSFNPLIYSIVLTSEEAYYGCYKTINYRGSLANVEFLPGSREGTVQVSFKGEIICIETIIASGDHRPGL